MVEVNQMIKDKSISEKSGGAWIVHMQNIGANAGTAIIRDHSGSSTYILRDLAAVLLSNEDYEQLVAAAEEEEEQHNLLRILMQCPEVMSATIHSPELSDIVIYLAIMAEQLAECLEEDGEEDGKSASISP
ncbi:Arginyl-tRNA synthetase [Pyrenophora teres f. maculata]|nr:Arginyl-tRNA synthetase [Pyrenophora teres f. maculata]